MMKRASKASLIIFLVTMLMTLNAPAVSACSCVSGTPQIYAISNAVAIFSGKVIQLTPVPLYGLQATVEVVQVWKGPVSQTLTVNAGVCAYPFEVSTEYLVYAYEDSGSLYSGICSHTQPLETAGKEIAVLDLLFSPSPRDKLQPSATVTVTGQGRYFARADQIEVHLLFQEPWQGEPTTEEMREVLLDLFETHSTTPELFLSGLYYSDEIGFHFIVDQEQLPAADLNAFFELLSKIEIALQQESELGVDQIEVRFSLQDCTHALASARSNALGNAQTRAELLAAVAGGKRGAIVALAETSSSSSPAATFDLCYAVDDEWHPIPLLSDPYELQQIEWRATVTVTFAVEEARVVQITAVPTSTAIMPSSVQVSPIPTPIGR